MASAWIATLAILFTLSGLTAESVSQPDDQIAVTEGDPLIVKCTYSFSGTPYMFWYVQYPNQGLQVLLKYFAGDNLVKGSFGFVAEFNKSQTSFHLKKPSALGSDSAVYFCAGSSINTGKLTFGDGTTLTVKPNIQNATPAVYQLKSHKSDTPICLFTDFDSKTNVSSVLNDTVISSENTVLDMKATNSKSNGVLVWSNTATLRCEEISDKISYYSSAGIPCDAKLIEKGFETDMNLNSQNLSVIALRILLLKVVGFNLLMTLRLWSS